MEEPGPAIEAEEATEPELVEEESTPGYWFKAGLFFAAAAVLDVIADEAGVGIDGGLLWVGILAVILAVSALWWFLRREERPLDQLEEMRREAEGTATSPRRSE